MIFFNVDVDGDVIIPLLKYPFSSVGLRVHFILKALSFLHLKGRQNILVAIFIATGTKIKSIFNAPDYVGGSFYCHNNYLTTLKVAPDYVGGDSYFKEITSLH